MKTLKDVDIFHKEYEPGESQQKEWIRESIMEYLNPNNWGLYADEDYDDENEMGKILDEPFLDIQEFELISKFIKYWFNIK